MDLKDIAERYLRKQERFYNRTLNPFNKFLIREFANFILKQNVTVEGEPFNDYITKHEYTEKITGKAIKVVFISEEIGSLTGGRYYAWFIAIALCELGYDVTIYTNQKPAYYDAFKNFKNIPKMEIIPDKRDLEHLDVPADIYIGSPLKGNLAVTTLAEKYHKPSYCLIFDPLPLMKKYLNQTFGGWELLVQKLRKSKVKIISLCNSTSESIGEWLNKTPGDIFPIYPCINSIELDRAIKGERKDYVVFISRLVPHKRIEDVLDAVKDTDLRLKIISSALGVDIEQFIEERKMEDQVDIYYKISDQEKFEMIYGARAVINGAIFEGFGMWAAEAVATGTPLVCYDFYTIREIQEAAGIDNFYLAEYNKPESLREQLQKCIKEAKFGERNHTFDVEAMVKRVKEVFSIEPRIGVITIALNEEKFIAASLKSVIKHKNVKRVVVVEGAVNLFSHAANQDGLSIDFTSDRVLDTMKEPGGYKITYERYGWANDKSELRNRALNLLGKDIDYVLVVDADEVWKQEDLDNLIQGMKDNPHTGVLLFNFYHFWKTKKLIATGGKWNSQMFRCFKYENKALHWKNHGAPVVDAQDRFINVTDGQVILDNVHVYHYGALKDEKRILDKLEYYRKRDTTLHIVDTWTHWKQGQETQWTHQGGTAEPFHGTHPSEVKDII